MRLSLNFMQVHCCALLLSFSLSVTSQLLANENWPEFRGPNANGISDSKGLPLTWSEEKNVKWKTPVEGKAWSSPVVWGDQVWVTNAPEDGKKLYAVCVDKNTGQVLHNITVFDIPEPQFCHEMNSYASCTPAIEEGRVYVHFGVHGTACIDTNTGKTIWSRQDLPCDHFRGPASSPALYEDKLFVHFDGFDLQYIVALDKETGKTVWKRDRNDENIFQTDNGDAKKAYGTPTIIDFAGRKQLISSAAGGTLSYDPETGETIWFVKHGGMNTSARPLFGHEKVYLNTAAGGMKLVAVRPDGKGDVSGSHIEWKTAKGVPTRSSQLLIGDYIYMVSDDGIASCVEAETGETTWQTRLRGKYCASPVFADGKIYLCDQDGKTTVIAANPEKYEELAENQLEDGFMASPAIAGKSLFLRTKSALYCIEQE